MGIGKSIKKAVKKVSKGIKTFIKDPLSKEGLTAAAGVALAPATAGASLVATANSGNSLQKEEEAQKQSQQKKADLEEKNMQMYGFKSLVDLENAKKKKMQELEGRHTSRASGIGSLIGQNNLLG